MRYSAFWNSSVTIRSQYSVLDAPGSTKMRGLRDAGEFCGPPAESSSMNKQKKEIEKKKATLARIELTPVTNRGNVEVCVGDALEDLQDSTLDNAGIFKRHIQTG